ncbi:uncharacterized protein FIBRA_00181 [Fibroporia radiculosa]|uniref:Uncharacterized protein n=1 Tax=Fibroporia radiculosa TaxID=599839 RepID=J7RGJ7_9APHY|nr:uncharacterized protein FIBRA_00181 [Fibroporia radiculosa]CCL98187.1 predicted protein [Fibroporia radiculosa]
MTYSTSAVGGSSGGAAISIFTAYHYPFSTFFRLMRLSAYPLLLAGVGLAIQQVGAAPLRVVVVTSHQELSTGPIAVPHPATHISPQPPHHSKDGVHAGMTAAGGAHKPCGSLREKAMRLSSKIFGFPAMAEEVHTEGWGIHRQPHHEHRPNKDRNRLSILPFYGTPTQFAPEGDVAAVDALPTKMEHSGHGLQRIDPGMGPVRIVHMNEQDDMRSRRFRQHNKPFLRRLHFALMALGPWEGRAVAFVLGCGIGVLLRMVWVMGVVLARMISGRRNDESAEDVFDLDAEEILVPPPQYTDEKIALAIDNKAPHA